MRTGDLQPGQLLAKVLRRLLRHARLRAEKIDPFPGLRAMREHRRTELNARHTGLERRAKELRAVDDADAVGQHEVRAVHGRHRLRVRAAGLHDLGIRRHHIVRALTRKQLAATRDRLGHGEIVKANA